MKQSSSIFAIIAIVACAAIMPTAAFAGNGDGVARTDSSPQKTEQVNISKHSEARGRGDSEREATEREHDADNDGSSRTANRLTAARPAATPFANLGSAPASTLKPIPVSAMGSTMVSVPASSLSTVSLSALSSSPSPAPVTAAPPPAPAPVIDGAALYNSLCAGCHGSSKRNRPVASTQAAISGNAGGMGSLSNLTPAQLQAIAAY